MEAKAQSTVRFCYVFFSSTNIIAHLISKLRTARGLAALKQGESQTIQYIRRFRGALSSYQQRDFFPMFKDRILLEQRSAWSMVFWKKQHKVGTRLILPLFLLVLNCYFVKTAELHLPSHLYWASDGLIHPVRIAAKASFVKLFMLDCLHRMRELSFSLYNVNDI